MAAWRPYRNLIEGELDNTTPGRVMGWIRFVGVDEPVTLHLSGDPHRDIRGVKIRFRNSNPVELTHEMREYMESFATHQTGAVGEITAGLPPQDYSSSPYIEWYSDQNGRIVLELEPQQVEVIGTPRPWQNEEPVSRQQQERNMAEWLAKLSADLGVPAILAGGSPGQSTSPETKVPNKKEAREKTPGPTKEFMLFDISENTDHFGRHGHILVARDGQSYEAALCRTNTEAPQLGQVLQVPLWEGLPNFGVFGFDYAKRLQDINPECFKAIRDPEQFVSEVALPWFFPASPKERPGREDREQPDQDQEHDQDNDPEITR